MAQGRYTRVASRLLSQKTLDENSGIVIQCVEDQEQNAGHPIMGFTLLRLQQSLSDAQDIHCGIRIVNVDSGETLVCVYVMSPHRQPTFFGILVLDRGENSSHPGKLLGLNKYLDGALYCIVKRVSAALSANQTLCSIHVTSFIPRSSRRSSRGPPIDDTDTTLRQMLLDLVETHGMAPSKENAGPDGAETAFSFEKPIRKHPLLLPMLSVGLPGWSDLSPVALEAFKRWKDERNESKPDPNEVTLTGTDGSRPDWVKQLFLMAGLSDLYM